LRDTRFILAPIQQTTVNLARIARMLGTLVHPASNEKRCHRFVADVAVDLEDIARLILQGLSVRFETSIAYSRRQNVSSGLRA
jgi:hypothetical protein